MNYDYEQDDVDWCDLVATDKQVEFLVILGMPRHAARQLTKEEAMEQIQRLKDRPTPKQVKCLESLCYTQEQIRKITKDEAKTIIGTSMRDNPLGWGIGRRKGGRR